MVVQLCRYSCISRHINALKSGSLSICGITTNVVSHKIRNAVLKAGKLGLLHGIPLKQTFGNVWAYCKACLCPYDPSFEPSRSMGIEKKKKKNMKVFHADSTSWHFTAFPWHWKNRPVPDRFSEATNETFTVHSNKTQACHVDR